jgi:transcriptional regulator with XRE-family HTH domain
LGGHQKRRADQIDLQVAERMRQRRVEMGMSQLELAGLLGINDRQLSKYESGTNRVSAARLYEIARALEVPVGWFYRAETEPAEVPSAVVRTLVKSYASLTSVRDRATLLEIVKTFVRQSRQSGG